MGVFTSPLTDKYRSFVSDLDDPAEGAFVITANDNVASAYTQPTRSIYIGVGGDINVRFVKNQSNVVFKAVPSGSILPVRVDMVFATGTTANSIVGMY